MSSTPRAPYSVDETVLRRFDQSHDGFSTPQAESPSFVCQDEHCVPAEPAAAEPTDLAQSRAAWQVHNLLGQHFFGDGESGPRAEDRADAAANTELVRRTARRFGADLVGVCRLNPTWLYARDRRGNDVSMPDGCEWAIVMAVAMNVDRIRRSPGPAADAASAMGYMRMAVCASGVGLFIRGLGYRAVIAGNGTALSIPLAADAGLGEMGRNGMLITREFGPCVRLCKVITDLPLRPDTPAEPTVQETCSTCRRCAQACPANAIDAGPEPSYATVCTSNNPGVLRWPVHAQRCLAFWHRNNASCSTCIAVCPYTPK